MKHRIFLTALLLVFWGGLTSTATAKHLHPEAWYQSQWCVLHGGQTEVVLDDQTRCDCLTETHAIEFDFGSKWAESLGQALHYSLKTGKRGGIVLIIESPGDEKYLDRVKRIIQHFGLPIDLWSVGVLP